MSPDDPRPDSPPADLDRQHVDLLDTLSVISDGARLLQRQILDASGLTTLERDQMLGGLASMRRELDVLRTQLEALVDLSGPSSDAPEASS